MKSIAFIIVIVSGGSDQLCTQVGMKCAAI